LEDESRTYRGKVPLFEEGDRGEGGLVLREERSDESPSDETEEGVDTGEESSLPINVVLGKEHCHVWIMSAPRSKGIYEGTS